MAGIGDRLARLEAAVGPACPGPPISIHRELPGGRVEPPIPEACPWCGRPVREHRPGVPTLIVLRPNRAEDYPSEGQSP